MVLAGIEHRSWRSSSPTLVGRRVSLQWFAVLLFFVSVGAWGQTRKPTEYDVKAAYLYNFGKFVKWPQAAILSQSTFPICVLGTDPFGSTLDNIASGEVLDGKRLSVVRISSASDARGCRILFIGQSEQGRVASVLGMIHRWPVLSVSDIPNFIDRGGMVGFVMQGDRVRFQVNLAAAESSGLSLSSELLKVAVSVKRDNTTGE